MVAAGSPALSESPEAAGQCDELLGTLTASWHERSAFDDDDDEEGDDKHPDNRGDDSPSPDQLNAATGMVG